MELEDDWDTQQFQNALKVVLKFEIQSLLERLSETGEETVVLTANTEDQCVGHLASPNAQRFVNTDDVGNIKNKFLFFLTGEEPCGELKLPALLNKQQNVLNKPTGGQTLGQSVGLAGKRRMEGTDADSAQFVAQPLNSKRRKLEPSPVPVKQPAGAAMPNASQQGTMVRPVGGPNKAPQAISITNDGNNTQNKRQHSLGVLGKEPAGLRLNTTKIVSKSGGYTEERITTEEFQKLQQKYNRGSFSDSEESFEDYDEDDELEEGEIGMIPGLGMQLSANKVFQNQNVASGSRQTTVANRASVSQGSVFPVSQAGAKVSQPASVVTENRKAGDVQKTSTNVGQQMKDSSKDDGGTVKSNAVATSNQLAKDNDVKKTGGSTRSPNPDIKVGGDVDKKQIETCKASGSVPDNTSTKQGDTNLSLEKENRPDGNQASSQKKCMAGPKTSMPSQASGSKPSMPSQTAGPKPNSQVKDRFPDNADELDTEELIRLTKEKHQEGMSEADKAIHAKLGQLSSKLSWVVEYPKEYPSGPGSQAAAGKQGFGTPGNLASGAEQYKVAPGDFDEDEEEEGEDYDEDEFAEEDLDEEDLALLREAHLRKTGQTGESEMEYGVGNHGMGPGYHVEMMGMMGEEGYDEEEYDGEYGHYGEYNTEEDMNMHNMGGMVGEEGNYEMEGYSEMDTEHVYTGGIQQPYQRMSSPTLDNYLIMGPLFAKCMMCMKIVRKSDMKQHHQTHMDEAAAMEEEEEEEEEEAFDENVHDSGGQYDEEEEEDEEEETVEFTAEKMVAEKVPEKTAGDKSKVCDICNKEFKSVSNMQRHRKIHTDKSNVPCPVCNKPFRLQSYLKKHLKATHPEYQPPKQEGSVPECGDGGGDISSDLFECGICHLTFMEEDSLQEHVLTHASTN